MCFQKSPAPEKTCKRSLLFSYLFFQRSFRNGDKEKQDSCSQKEGEKIYKQNSLQSSKREKSSGQHWSYDCDQVRRKRTHAAGPETIFFRNQDSQRHRQGRAGLSVSSDHQGKACHGTAQLRERLGKPEYNIFIKFSAIIHWYFLLQYKFCIFRNKIQ